MDDTFALWMDHIARYSRRDQLSVNFVFDSSDLSINPIYVDNENSEWHRWLPLSEMARDRGISAWSNSSHTRRTAFVWLGDQLDKTFAGRRVTWAMDKLGLYQRFVA